MDDNAGIVSVLAAPLIALVTIDVIMLLFGYEFLKTGPTGSLKFLSSRLVMYGHFLFSLPAFWVVILAARLGKKGITIGCCSVVLSYLISTRYRGPWAWQGTFDWYQGSQAPWLWSALVGLILGVGWVWFVHRSKIGKGISARVDIVYIATLAIACFMSLAASVLWPISSFIAPKLHLALGTSAIVLTCLWLTFVRNGEAK